MRFKMTKLDVWVAEIDDSPGGLARTMRTAADHGADLDCVVARRQPNSPGKGVVFMGTIKGRDELDRASAMGPARATHLATLKIEAPDRPGFGAELTKAIADAGINLHGLTAAVVGRRCVCYASFDTIADLERAQDALTALGAQMRRSWRELLMRKSTEKEKIPA